MTATALDPRAPSHRARRAIAGAGRVVQAAAWPPLVQLVLRLALAVPFFKSGWLKWDGFLQLSDNAVALFTDVFQLHLPGGPYPYPAPAAQALAAACLEVVLPVLLVAGIGTRFTAALLLGMTGVIQLTVPDGWPIHLTWAAMALALMAHGAGPLSADHLLARRWAAGSARRR